MPFPHTVAAEARSPVRIALYAGGVSLLLIAAYVATMSLRTRTPAAPSGVPVALAAPDPRASAALRDARDGADFDEDAAYVDGYRAVRAQPVPPWDSPPLDHKAVLADPARFRARPVRARGVLMHMEAIRLPHPVDDQRDVFRGYVMDPDGSRTVVFDMVTQPSLDFTLRKDTIDVVGVFYRKVSYEALEYDEKTKEKKPILREIPYLLAHSLRTVPPAQPWHGLPTEVAAILGIAGGLGIVLLARSRARAKNPPRTSLAYHAILRHRAASAEAAAKDGPSAANERT